MLLYSAFYHGYFDDKKQNTRTFCNIDEMQYVLFRSGVGFSKRMLMEIDLQICIGVVSFESATEIYNNL